MSGAILFPIVLKLEIKYKLLLSRSCLIEILLLPFETISLGIKMLSKDPKSTEIWKAKAVKQKLAYCISNVEFLFF